MRGGSSRAVPPSLASGAPAASPRCGGPDRRPGLAADPRDGLDLHAVPGHRPGLRGRLLRAAVAPAAGPGAVRRRRVLRQARWAEQRPGPDQDKITDLASKVLTERHRRDTITPTLEGRASNGRADLISIGFLLSLWSGSRVLNVFIDTISIMYGQSGVRGIVRTRVLSFSLYVASLIVGRRDLPAGRARARTCSARSWRPRACSCSGSTGRSSRC